ncbi:MAG: hypothetical protein NZ455_02320 [Bacteroidia bacterium]|nr:hypothetical protein [Bacteroidia bacterium]MDW8346796.1 hypothetical protein [Bacteroidia bacterium]
MGRSTEAIAQPAARRPCLHECSETQARARPKRTKNRKTLNIFFSVCFTHKYLFYLKFS